MNQKPGVGEFMFDPKLMGSIFEDLIGSPTSVPGIQERVVLLVGEDGG